jgi:aryl-alcohol dehydrogenase-like predicted oxidoreductase
VPANIADCRFEQSGLLTAAAKLDIAVFVRSVFLQGVLLMTPERLPEHLKAFTPLLAALVDAGRRSGRSVLELLITAVRDVPGVTSLVLGVDTVSQLEPQMKALLTPPLPPAIREDLIRSASHISPHIFMPTNWKHLAGSG